MFGTFKDIVEFFRMIDNFFKKMTKTITFLKFVKLSTKIV